MDLFDYNKLLNSWDYYYSYSDDHRVWSKGEAQTSEINRIAQLSEHHKDLYDIYADYYSSKIDRETFFQRHIQFFNALEKYHGAA